MGSAHALTQCLRMMSRRLDKEEYLVTILGRFFLFLHKTYPVATHQKCPREVLIKNAHDNICFYGELVEIFSELSSNTFPE